MKSRYYNLSLIIVGAVLVYWLFWHSSSLVAPLHLPNIAAVKFLARWGLSIIPMILVLFLLHKPREIIHALGLDGSLAKGLGWAFACTLPLFVGFSVCGDLNTEITFREIIHKAVLAAFFEELVFRGFVFGQLFRYGKIGFLWAALAPAILFGILHIYQGHDLLSSLMAFGVTFLGALYFSWIYVEWNFNLWFPIGLHFFMNLSWMLFVVEGTEGAAGGLISNIFRIVSIILVIYLTIRSKRKSGSKVFDYPVIRVV